MDGIAIAGGVVVIIIFIIIAWQVYNRKRRPQLRCSVVIADSLQLQLVCRYVPCQHPYYRVISEYSGQAASQEMPPSDSKVGGMFSIGLCFFMAHPLCKNLIDGATTEPETEEKKSPTKFDYNEWSRSLSLSSISRKSSHPNYTRRCSTSDVGRAIRPTTKTKTYFVA